MSVYRPKLSPYWHYDFQVKGVRFHGSTGAPDKPTAKAVEAKKRVEAVEGLHLRRKPVLTLNEAFGRYFDQHAGDLPSAYTIDYQLGNLLEGLGCDALLPQVGDAQVADYISRRRSEVSNSSVNRELTMLRAVFLMARDHWGTDVGDMPNWRCHKLREPANRERYLSVEEEARLLKALRPDMATLVRFCLITGARLSNARRLSWSDIDYDAGIITFRGMKSARRGKRHAVPLTHELRVLLANERSKHALFVFTYECRQSRDQRKRGERYPFSKGGWRKHWKAALEAAEIDDFRFHDLRHTAATRILRKTGNLAVVQKILGHSDITTTTRYAHVIMDDMRSAMEAVSRNTPEVADGADNVAAESQLKNKRIARNGGTA